MKKKKAKPTVRTTLALDLEVRTALEKYADERRMSLTEAIHEIVRAYLSSSEKESGG